MSPCADHRAPAGRAGFTLAETLAALVFMALVVPVAVMGLRVATQAGVAAVRRDAAMRVADRVLNEMVVTGQWQKSGSGVAEEGADRFRWRLESRAWEKDTMKVVSVFVTYEVQGTEHEARASTLVDGTQQ